MISRDPDRRPSIDPDQIAEAKRAGLHLIQIICEEDDSDTAEVVTFIAAVHFVPRIGEMIVLEDGKRCRIEDVGYTVNTIGKLHTLFPIISATIVQEENE